jgi:hypothetical protein
MQTPFRQHSKNTAQMDAGQKTQASIADAGMVGFAPVARQDLHLWNAISGEKTERQILLCAMRQ